MLNIYISPWKDPISKASKFWKSLCRDANLTKENFHFKVTPNSHLSLYWDHWFNGKPLIEISELSAQPQRRPLDNNKTPLILVLHLYTSCT
ncbi:hypothetical protein MA16_Dca010070 [Dendrobium catenatum]|uniref:Uncharacterized protein n=1 Tax=Dendrobium catenatum TaxID=906689 RepID=A0A2I0X6Y7_9ASPA|nr:hypothetical protein MA16_Dca010070 [Dendrobium catenatum]